MAPRHTSKKSSSRPSMRIGLSQADGPWRKARRAVESIAAKGPWGCKDFEETQAMLSDSVGSIAEYLYICFTYFFTHVCVFD